MAKSIASIDQQIAELRAQRKAQKQRERTEARQRVRRAQQKLGTDLAKAVGATTEEEVARLRAVVLDPDRALPRLQQQLGADSATEASAEVHSGGDRYGDQ